MTQLVGAGVESIGIPTTDHATIVLYVTFFWRQKMKPTPTHTFETVRSEKNNEYYWRIKHRNGKEICRSSETYKRKATCLTAFHNMIKAIAQGEMVHANAEEAIIKMKME